MDAPVNLSAKPIVSVNDYDNIDGKYVGGDAKALSICNSTWNDGISAKVWRYVTTEKGGAKWSRMSEELPLNRVLDLSILLILCFMNMDKGENKCWKPEQVLADFPIHQNGEQLSVVINKWWIDVKGKPAPNENDIRKFYENLRNELDKGNLKERFRVIKKLLNEDDSYFKEENK